MRNILAAMSLFCCIAIVFSACDSTDVSEETDVSIDTEKLPPLALRETQGTDDGCGVGAWEVAATIYDETAEFRVIVTNLETGVVLDPESSYSDPYDMDDGSDVFGNDCDWIANSSGGGNAADVHKLDDNTLYEIKFDHTNGNDDRTFLYMDCPSGGTADRTCTQGDPAVNLHDVYFVYTGDGWFVRPAHLTGADRLGSAPTYGSWEGVDDFASSGWILNDVLPDICDELEDPCSASEETASYFLQDGNPDEMKYYWPRYNGDLAMTWDPECGHDCSATSWETEEHYCTDVRGAVDWDSAVEDSDSELESGVRAAYVYRTFYGWGWYSGSGTYSDVYYDSITCTY